MDGECVSGWRGGGDSVLRGVREGEMSGDCDSRRPGGQILPGRWRWKIFSGAGGYGKWGDEWRRRFRAAGGLTLSRRGRMREDERWMDGEGGSGRRVMQSLSRCLMYYDHWGAIKRHSVCAE